jgi:hypothetical protein
MKEKNGKVLWKEAIKRYVVAIEGTLNRRDPRKKEARGVFEELRSHSHIKAKDMSKADRETMNGDLK